MLNDIFAHWEVRKALNLWLDAGGTAEQFEAFTKVRPLPGASNYRQGFALTNKECGPPLRLLLGVHGTAIAKAWLAKHEDVPK